MKKTSSIRLSLAIQTQEVQTTIPVALISGSFEEKLMKAASFGADGVELMTTDPRALDTKAVRTQLQASGLEASAVASGALAFAAGLTLLNADPEKAHQARIRLADLIRFASELGAPVVTIGSFRGRVASVGAEGKKQLADILWDSAEYARLHGVRLALEPLNRYETDFIVNVEEGLAFVKEMNHPSLGLLLDTYHMNIEESSRTEPFRLARTAEKLFHIHLGDNNRLYPGGGLIDFPAIVKTLREIGYTGYLSAELLARPDPDTAAQRTLSYMRSILEG